MRQTKTMLTGTTPGVNSRTPPKKVNIMLAKCADNRRLPSRIDSYLASDDQQSYLEALLFVGHSWSPISSMFQCLNVSFLYCYA
jgi:hypothetical protein